MKIISITKTKKYANQKITSVQALYYANFNFTPLSLIYACSTGANYKSRTGWYTIFKQILF